MRWSAFHICLPSHPLFQALKGLLFVVVRKELRARARYHDCELHKHDYSIPPQKLSFSVVWSLINVPMVLVRQIIVPYPGSPLEWQYSLLSYGINAKVVLPVIASGNIKTKTHNKCMNFWRAMEDARRRSIPLLWWDWVSGCEWYLFSTGWKFSESSWEHNIERTIGTEVRTVQVEADARGEDQDIMVGCWRSRESQWSVFDWRPPRMLGGIEGPRYCAGKSQ